MKAFLVRQTQATWREQHKILNSCSLYDHCLYYGLKNWGSHRESKSTWLRDCVVTASNLLQSHKGSKWRLPKEPWHQCLLRGNIWLWKPNAVCMHTHVSVWKERRFPLLTNPDLSTEDEIFCNNRMLVHSNYKKLVLCVAKLVSCIVPSLELYSEWEYQALCRLTALCTTGPNKLCKYVPCSFIVNKLHESRSVGWALRSSAPCVLSFWRGPKGTSCLVPKQVWQGCCFCYSCNCIPLVSRKILRNALRWKDKSCGEMWICERSAFWNIVDIIQLSWWTKKAEKL